MSFTRAERRQQGHVSRVGVGGLVMREATTELEGNIKYLRRIKAH